MPEKSIVAEKGCVEAAELLVACRAADDVGRALERMEERAAAVVDENVPCRVDPFYAAHMVMADLAAPCVDAFAGCDVKLWCDCDGILAKGETLKILRAACARKRKADPEYAFSRDFSLNDTARAVLGMIDRKQGLLAGEG